MSLWTSYGAQVSNNRPQDECCLNQHLDWRENIYFSTYMYHMRPDSFWDFGAL